MSPTTQKIELNPQYEQAAELLYCTWAYMDCQLGGSAVSCRMTRNDFLLFIFIPLFKNDCVLRYDFNFSDGGL